MHSVKALPKGIYLKMSNKISYETQSEYTYLEKPSKTACQQGSSIWSSGFLRFIESEQKTVSQPTYL